MSIKVGGEVLSFCGSCKMDLIHTVIALNQTKIQKCQCRTCKAIHGYKTPRGVKDPHKYKETIEKTKKVMDSEKTGGKTRSVKEILSHDAHWEKMMLNTKNMPAIPYSAKTPFKVGTVIKHPTFGDGFIEKLIHPNKVEVVFKMETKVLIHGGSSAGIAPTATSPKPPHLKNFT